MLPSYFYDLNGIIDLKNFPAGTIRWFDQFTNPDQTQRVVLAPGEGALKMGRDMTYNNWFKRHGIRPRNPQFQAIRILTEEHSERMAQDWWREYKDCLFRVFLNPHVEYSGHGHKQWYVISPEDSFLMRSYEAIKQGHPAPDRSSFNWICPNPEFAKCRMVPTECCRQIWRETVAGQMEHEAVL